VGRPRARLPAPAARHERSRLPELAAVEVPRLVVQGSGTRSACRTGPQVHVVRGADHAFAVRRKDGRTPQEVHDEVRDVVAAWLQTLT
jgi:hypothetical protein